MPIHYSKKVISSTDVEKIVALSENWIMDMKGKDIKPAKLSRTVSAFANSNGGEIYLGISHLDDKDQYFWDGYKNNIPYGFKKDPEVKHHWLIDEEAAAVVRRIFQLSVEGHGPGQIALILLRDKVERPSYYFAKQGRGTCQNKTDMSRPYDWCSSTVRDILAKPEYMGHTVNFRAYTPSYKEKKMIKRPPEEWLIFENTHEAIVDPETWKLAQHVRETVRRTDTTGVANPLTGLLFCADCGAKLHNHRAAGRAIQEGRGPDPESGLFPNDHYNCSAYMMSVNANLK